MTHRPVIEDGTVDRVNEKLEDVVRVNPEKIGLDEKINILVDEIEDLQDELEDTETLENRFQALESKLNSISNTVRDVKMNTGDGGKY